MDKYKKEIEKYKYVIILVFVGIIFLFLINSLLSTGLDGLTIVKMNWFTLFVYLIIFTFLSAFLIRKEILFTKCVASVELLIKKYIPAAAKYSIEMIIFFIFLFISILFLFGSNRSSVDYNTGSNFTENYSVDLVSEEPETIDYNTGSNYSRLWIGSMNVEKFSSKQQMHATYTFDFLFKLMDEERTITKVEIVDISAESSLPKGDLKILSYAHSSRSDNGGNSVPTQLRFEDWNTFGYVYASDYSKMTSLDTTYTPDICLDAEIFCNYLDEIGKKGGSMALRFKYINVGGTVENRPEYQIAPHLDAHGLTASQLSGTFSWTLIITLDDGSVHEKLYSVIVNGNKLDLNSSNTTEVAKY